MAVLLNVRLTKADQEAVRILKQSGVAISNVVRTALRQEAAKHRGRTAASTRALIQKMFEAFPEPVDPPSRDFDVHDRQAVAVAFRAHLGKKFRSRR